MNHTRTILSLLVFVIGVASLATALHERALTAQLPSAADLSITLTADAVTLSQSIKFTMTAKNAGPNGIQKATAYVLLIKGLEFDPSGSDPRCRKENEGPDQPLIWCEGFALESNQNTTFNVRAKIIKDLDCDTKLKNQAFIYGSTDPNTKNNSSEIVTTTIYCGGGGGGTGGGGVPPTPPKPFCGNTVIDAKEECDDGNHKPGDGCGRFCKKEYCGDKVVSTGEECDDGNKRSNDGCSTECIFEYCGDGVLQTNWEKCDDGNVESDDGCNWQCRVDTVKAKDTGGDGSGGSKCLTLEEPVEMKEKVEGATPNDDGTWTIFKNLSVSCDNPKCAFGPCSWKGNTKNIDCLFQGWGPLKAVDCKEKDCSMGPCNGPVHVEGTSSTLQKDGSVKACIIYTDKTQDCRNFAK